MPVSIKQHFFCSRLCPAVRAARAAGPPEPAGPAGGGQADAFLRKGRGGDDGMSEERFGRRQTFGQPGGRAPVSSALAQGGHPLWRFEPQLNVMVGTCSKDTIILAA